MLLARAWHTLATFISTFNPLQTPVAGGRHDISSPSSIHEPPTFTLSSTWDILGPFQIGTREVAWGSDPLEQYGGFRSLSYDPTASFRSSIAVNGSVSWSQLVVEPTQHDADHASTYLTLQFPDVEQPFLRDVYGWAAVQWQAWATSQIIVHSDVTEPIHLNTPSITEFWIDDVHYFGGDFYQYKRAPVTLFLTPGVHRIDVRLVRDVRSMGGFGVLAVHAQIDMRRSEGLLHLQGPFLISDSIGNETSTNLASPYASALLRNDAQNEIDIVGIDPGHNNCVGELVTAVQLLPGQSRPVAFRINCIAPPSNARAVWMEMAVKYRDAKSQELFILDLTAEIPVRDSQEPHKVTFLHPGGVVSYAILRPPSHRAEEAQPESASLPVMLGLHGAGLEAEDELVKHALDTLPDLPTWVLFPTGGSPWSGDDWHAWGLADVEAAIAMIPDWIERNEWQGSRVRLHDWLVSGHSNGGQGTWYLLTHRPDNVFAAAILSGYSSIQNYVPYTFWQVAEPGRMAITHAALNSYRHELLLPNSNGIPLLQQHGDHDDNIPIYNARLMRQRLSTTHESSEYYEFFGKNHFWEGCFATEPLKEFYERQLSNGNRTRPTSLSGLRDFSIVSANPGDTGSKHGIQIYQLASPGQLGRIDIAFDHVNSKCSLWTTNIHMFYLPPYFHECSIVLVDNQQLNATALEQHEASITMVRVGGKWVSPGDIPPGSPPTFERLGRQLGAMDAILRTHGTFQIVQHSNTSEARHIAMQISRNLCQYYAADTSITSDYDHAVSATGNVISVAIGNDLPQSYYENHPIQIVEQGTQILLRVDDSHTHTSRYTTARGHGLAAIYLRPLPSERLELVVWGADAASLDVAARLVPLLPGTGVPDFVITDTQMLWKGIEGTLALGFFDYAWQVSRPSSFLT